MIKELLLKGITSAIYNRREVVDADYQVLVCACVHTYIHVRVSVAELRSGKVNTSLK